MRNGRRTIILSALAGGAVAGALIGAKRPRRQTSRALALAEPVFELPVPADRVRHEAPVIYEATVHAPARARWVHVSLIFCAAALAAMLLTLLVSARPRIAASAPVSVFSGSPANIAYALAGSGSADFTVDSVDGHRSGSLRARDGVIAVAAKPQTGDINVTLRMRGWLGADARVVRVHVLRRPAPVIRILPAGEPVIRAFALSKPAASGGTSIVARYDTNASSGSLRLVDAAGAVWSSSPVRGRGSASIAVPLVHRDTPFIVVLHAERNVRAAEAGAGFIALAKTTPPDVVADSFHNQPAFTVPARVRGGTTLQLAVPASIAGMDVSLRDTAGAQLASASGRRSQEVSLRVPPVNSARPSFASLTYEYGKQVQTVVRPILIVP